MADATTVQGIQEGPAPLPRQLDQTIPGGRYIKDARFDRPSGKHFGGKIVNADGETLDEFEPNEVNTGIPRMKAKPKSHEEQDAEGLRKELDKADADKAEIQRQADATAEQLRQANARIAEMERQQAEQKALAEAEAQSRTEPPKAPKK